MIKAKVVLIFLMMLLSTHFCYAIDVEIDKEVKTISKSDQSIIQTDLRFLINLDLSYFNLIFGKDQLVWGVGQTGTLGLSTTSPSIPIFSYQITIPSIRYDRFVSPLECNMNRWLFGQRLEGKVKSLEVGVWELMLCSKDVFYGYFLPVPIIPLYAVQHIANKLNEEFDNNSNAMVGVDFKYYISDFGEVYGELLIDDFPQKSEYDNPKKIGGLFGIRYDFSDKITIWSEYIRINNFVYTHKNPYNRYLYQDQPLGHWLGMDGDLCAIRMNQIVNENTKIYYQFDIIRKGEGDYDDNWKWEYNSNYDFLTGIVENSYQLHGKVEHDVSENLELTMSAIIGQSINTDHLENKRKNYSRFQIALKLHFDFFNSFN